MGFYLLVAWLYRTFIVGARTNNLGPFLAQVEFLLVLIVPVLTMRLLSDELRTGSIDLLWVRGVTPVKLILAKFSAAAVFVIGAVSLPVGLAAWFTARLTGPDGLDAGVLTAQVIGVCLIGFVLVALGVAASALSHNPLVTALIAAVVGFFLWFIDAADLSAVWLQRMLGLRLHLAGFNVGELRLNDLWFFFSLVVVFLSAGVLALKFHRS
ncbi:MAG: ABC transporter permease subunit [Actinomycetota bacterium]